jgi:thiamine-phosphate pyrophosphorylase
MADHPVRGLYAITDPSLLADGRLEAAVAAALAGGARLVQYRDKPASRSRRLQRATALRRLCEAHGARLLVNDDVELAMDAGAHGVHLGQSDGDVRQARAQLGADAIIGVTCHADPALAQAAVAAGASYVAFGRFFPSHTKPQAPSAPASVLGHDLPVPKVAIGGITPDNAPQLIRAGASALAVIHALFASDDIEATARRFARLFPEDP